jgi:hypothetical protein
MLVKRGSVYQTEFVWSVKVFRIEITFFFSVRCEILFVFLILNLYCEVTKSRFLCFQVFRIKTADLGSRAV